MSFNWADDGEDEIMEQIQKDITEKKKVERRELKKIADEISRLYLEKADEYCQIGLVIYMIMCQKTINIFREGKEDREYNASVLMKDVQTHLTQRVSTYKWTEVIHMLCDMYKDKVKGSLLIKAKELKIDPTKTLQLSMLERTVARNRKSYIERTGRCPNT